MWPISMGNSEQYGRGIFAIRNIKKGELIEIAPVLVIPKKEWKLMRKGILSNYVFWWKKAKAIALGYGSLYNHSYTPNARYITNMENQSIDFYARKDIRKGEEIMINYNGDPKDLSPLWFKVIN